MPDNETKSAPTPSSRTDWAKLNELQRQFEQAMKQVQEGARKVNEGLNRRQSA